MLFTKWGLRVITFLSNYLRYTTLPLRENKPLMTTETVILIQYSHLWAFIDLSNRFNLHHESGILFAVCFIFPNLQQVQLSQFTTNSNI